MFFETLGVILCAAGIVPALKGTTSPAARLGMFALILFTLLLFVL